jgi:hypothetical protein
MSSLKAHTPSPQLEQSLKQLSTVSRAVQRMSPQMLQSSGHELTLSLA